MPETKDINLTKRILAAQGGTASPLVFVCDGEQEVFFGMTMREHYSGLAMQALSSRLEPESAAKRAVRYADALIKALNA